jgi:hypothetical protein
MIKKLLPVLAAVMAPALLFAGSASAATHHHKPRTFASCRAKGRHAKCLAEGTAKRPSSLWLHVRAQPHQRVIVGWAVECFKGSAKGHKGGAFIGTAAPTLTRKMAMKYKHPDRCIAAADAELTKKGSSIHVWLTVGR